MAKTIIKKSSVKASASKPLGKPPTGYKTLGIDLSIHLHDIKYVDDTEEVEESEILFIYTSILAASKQNLVKKKFPYIKTFDYEGPTVLSSMRNLTGGVFDHLDITSHMGVYKSLAYTQRILRGAAIKKYREVMVSFRQLAKELAGDEWNLNELAGISTEDL